MSELLRDVIEIPEHAGAEDYVLRLTDSVGADHAATAVDNYVVTPALADAFEHALALVADAVVGRISRGAFLTGSFGSGKSHFMAVLHAVLRQEPAARAKAELQPVIAQVDPVLRDKKILPLAFHLLGAESLEDALFSGYIRQIRALHPTAPLPSLHESDALLADAERMRGALGDQEFFAQLNGASGADDGVDEWSALLGTGTWNADSYAQARAASPESTQRQSLVSSLVERFFQAYVRQAGYVDLDTGLAAISAHAQALDYDAVVLFLDELVLWLAFAVQDREFFRRESQKITKLVEAGVGHRPIPLVSFVARQMDLRRWFADAGASGAEQDALDRAFRHQEGRFAQIALGDDNLPYVAQQRLLRPKNEEARRILDGAFDRLSRRSAVWDVLLDGINTDEQHRGADEAAFRQTYPFSPALVSTLRSLASVMQRERTALKVMQQMLVDRRDTLTVDDVIPVGDAFPYVVQGAQPLDQKVAALFRSANTLYVDKLRPLLRAPYELTELQLNGRDPMPTGLATNERLAQTLLLSAVAPNVPALKGLTASRLASLNHGSIVSPLPGDEATLVASRVRDWARDVPEIHLDSDTRNPVVRMQLSDVDYESIVEKAKGEDNEGRRRELIKSMVASGLGIELGAEDIRGAYVHQIIWRGSRREVDLVFGNVRDRGWLSDDQFRNRPNTWRVIIDHPFDQAGHSSAEDYERLDSLVSREFLAQTIVWLPRFFTEERMRDVRRLVILNWLLDGSGDRWTSHADHLSETDRVQARAILESSRTTLRHAIERAIQVAYEAAAPSRPGDVIEDAHERVLTSLDRGFDPRRPVGVTLASAFGNLLEQAYDATYPAHPRFQPSDVEVRIRELKAVYEHVERAMADPERRVPLQGDIAAVRRIANQLGVGHAAETHFVFGDDRLQPWATEFERELGRRGNTSGPVTVGEVRGWIEGMAPPRGLRPEVTDLVVLAWAALRRRAWFAYGAPIAAPVPGALRPEMEMRQQPMPEAGEWSTARERAGRVFGIAAGRHLTPQAVAELAQRVKDSVQASYQAAQDLVPALENVYRRLGIHPNAETSRLVTARNAAELTQVLRHLDGVDLIRRLAGANVGNETALASSISSAARVTSALTAFRWERLRPLQDAQQGEGGRAEQAAAILEDLRRSLESDEMVTAIAQALEAAEAALFAWLTPPSPHRSPSAHPEPTPAPRTTSGRRTLAAGENPASVVADLQAFRNAHGGAGIIVEWRLDE
ncbi:MAG: DUF6079 family protein [Microlunatus sp.]